MIMMLIRFATWQDCTYLVHLVIKIADFYLHSVGLECIVKGKQFVSTKPTGRWGTPVGFPYRGPVVRLQVAMILFAAWSTCCGLDLIPKAARLRGLRIHKFISIL